MRVAPLRPVLRAALTSCSLMAAGDVTCQLIQAQRTASHTHASPSRAPSERRAQDAGAMLAHGAREAPAGQHVDWQRTARFALVGLTLHGPFFFWGFKWLDGLRVATGGSPLIRAMAKSATGQVTLFPTYILAFSVYMGLLEGRRGAALAVKGCGQPDVDLPSPITSPAIIAIAVPALTRQASPPPRRKGPHVRRPGLRSREPLLAGG